MNLNLPDGGVQALAAVTAIAAISIIGFGSIKTIKKASKLEDESLELLKKNIELTARESICEVENQEKGGENE